MIVQSEVFEKSTTISVVIITYNQERTIRQTIDSILNQDFDHSFEIIIAEDGGTDSTRDICLSYQKQYPERIKLLLQDKNKGVLKNYFEAVSLANGKYVTQCAGDDYWHNTAKLTMQFNYLENHPDCGIVHTEYDELNDGTKRVYRNRNFIQKKEIPEGYIINNLFLRYHIIAPTVAFRREIFERYVPVNEIIDNNFPAEDVPTFVIMSKYCKVAYLPVSTATYRIVKGSVSHPKVFEKAESYYESIRKQNLYLCTMFPDDLVYDEEIQLTYSYMSLLSLAYRSNNFTKARQYSVLLEQIGVRNHKILIGKSYVLFSLFVLLKNFKLMMTKQYTWFNT